MLVLCAMLAAGNAGAQTTSDLSRRCMTDLLGYCWRTDFGAPVAVEGTEHLLVAEPAPTTPTPVTTVGSSEEAPVCLHVVGQSYDQCTMPNGFQFLRESGGLAPLTTWQGLPGGAEMECGWQADGPTIPCAAGISVPTLDEARRICERHVNVVYPAQTAGGSERVEYALPFEDACHKIMDFYPPPPQTERDIAALKAFVEHQKQKDPP